MAELVKEMYYTTFPLPEAASRLRKVLRIIVVFLLFVSCGCSDGGDITNRPEAGNFRDVIGVWRSKEELTLIADREGEWVLSRDPVPLEKGITVISRVPVGTEIAISKLFKKPNIPITLFQVDGNLVSGPYAGIQCYLDLRLFLPSFVTNGGTSVSKWAVDSRVLEK